jgi:hypothetical protein
MDEITFNHMMVDIETLGTAMDATVIAIGVALFNPEAVAIGPQFCYLPALECQGGTVSPDTLHWWLKTNQGLLGKYIEQSPEVGTPFDWRDISVNLANLIYGYEVDTIWANGIDFDIPILSAAFERTKVDNPLETFNYKQRRDMRQWKLAASLAGWLEPERPKELVAHDALADAVWQCRVVCNLWQFLANRR